MLLRFFLEYSLEISIISKYYGVQMLLLVQFRASAMNFEFLTHACVNYVLNVAEGTKPGCVDTNQVSLE